jgi:hypothetical protein
MTCSRISLVKQQFVITHQFRIFQETENTWLILNRTALKHVMFLRQYKDKQFFCGHNILTEGLFVMHLSSNAGISVWQIVWFMTNYHFMSSLWFKYVILHEHFFMSCLLSVSVGCQRTILFCWTFFTSGVLHLTCLAVKWECHTWEGGKWNYIS